MSAEDTLRGIGVEKVAEWNGRLEAVTNERDQLRADLAAAQLKVAEHMKRAVTAEENERAAQRTITQLGEDAIREQARYDKARELARDFTINHLVDCTCLWCAWLAQDKVPSRKLEDAVTPGAQGKTERVREVLLGGLAAGRIHLRLDAIDARLVELRELFDGESRAGQDTDNNVAKLDDRVNALYEEFVAQRKDDSELGRRIAALESCASESWQIGKPAPFVPHRPEPFEGRCRCGHPASQPATHVRSKACAPPQSAPVERHAFVDGPHNCMLNNCSMMGHPCQRSTVGVQVCGQPRSAAVHGEGGK